MHRQQGLNLSVYVEDVKNGWKDAKPEHYCGRNWWNSLILENEHHFLTTCSRDALNVTANRTKVLLINTEKMFESGISAGATETSRTNSSVVLRHERTCGEMRGTILRTGKQESGPTLQSIASLFGWSPVQAGGTRISWRIIRSLLTDCSSHANTITCCYGMEGHAWNDTANWRIERLSNCIRTVRHVLMTINSKRRKWKRWEDSQKFDVKLSYNACFWNALVDLTFCGRWTNWHEQSQTGQDHVTDDWLVWFHTFTTRVITGNAGVWWSTARHCRLGLFHDSDFAGDLEDSNIDLGEVYVASDVERLFASLGCAGSKHQYPTVLQSLKPYKTLNRLWKKLCEPLGVEDSFP